jgi:hypothetical protein
VARYGIVCWGNSTQENMKKVLTLQKKALRVIFKLKARESCRKYFKLHKIMTIPSMYMYNVILYACYKNISLTRNTDVHQYNTRGKHNIFNDHCRISILQKTPEFSGKILFNKLPSEIKAINNMEKKFKNILKDFFVKNAFYSIQEYVEG